VQTTRSSNFNGVASCFNLILSEKASLVPTRPRFGPATAGHTRYLFFAFFRLFRFKVQTIRVVAQLHKSKRNKEL
jgi:hypothetical protein